MAIDACGPSRGALWHGRQSLYAPSSRSSDAERRGMTDIVEEIRAAYRAVGIALDHPATFGTYHRLLCAGCGEMVGNVGDKLLPGMAAAVVDLHEEGSIR